MAGVINEEEKGWTFPVRFTAKWHKMPCPASLHRSHLRYGQYSLKVSMKNYPKPYRAQTARKKNKYEIFFRDKDR